VSGYNRALAEILTAATEAYALRHSLTRSQLLSVDYASQAIEFRLIAFAKVISSTDGLWQFVC